MDRLDQLNVLYDHYHTELAKVKKAAGHGGFMGLGMDPRKIGRASCRERV